MDNPEKDIKLPPSGTILMDGNGYMALAGKGEPTQDGSGKEIVTYTIEPNERARRMYNFRRGKELDAQEGTMKLIVAKKDLRFLNLFDDANRMVLYIKSFKGEETELSQSEKTWRMNDEYKDNIILRQDAEIIKLQEELEQAKTNIGKYVSAQNEVFKEQMKAFGEAFNKEDKK